MSRLADEACADRPGPGPRQLSASRQDHRRGASKRAPQAIHPGYGFLSENAAFAEACAAAGLVFIGPPACGHPRHGLARATAKALMEKAGVPLVPGYHGEDQDEARLAEAARRIGYPGADQGLGGRRRQGHARGRTRRGVRSRAGRRQARGLGLLRR